MKNDKSIFILMFLAFTVCFMACNTSQSFNNTNAESIEEVVEVNPNNMDLTQLLQAEPGVFVSGSGHTATISIRGVNSFNLTNEPLFIINGNQVPSYSSLYYMVDNNSIKSIRVLKNAADTTYYGINGANGVIVIETK